MHVNFGSKHRGGKDWEMIKEKVYLDTTVWNFRHLVKVNA